MAAIPGADSVSTRQQRIAELARQAPQVGFTSLNHHLNFTWLLAAYWGTRRDGATGVDGITAADYEADPGCQPAFASGSSPPGTARSLIPSFLSPLLSAGA